jgi:hypothetical protein
MPTMPPVGGATLPVVGQPANESLEMSMYSNSEMEAPAPMKPPAGRRRLTMQEELVMSVGKLRPMQAKKAPKEEPKKVGMSNILQQIAIRKKQLDEGGNIVKKNNVVDEESDDEDSSEDSFD